MFNDVLVHKKNTMEVHSYFKVKHKEIDNFLSLDGKWNFIFSNDVSYQICEENFMDCKQIIVPSNIEFSGYGRKQYVNTQYPWEARETLYPTEVPNENSIGMYQKKVAIPKDWKRKKLIISFQGVESAFELYINNEFIGYAEDSHTPSEFDLSKFLECDNIDIKVKVYKFSTASWLEDQDFWRIFGIHRSVFLMAREENFISDIRVNQIFSKDNSKVKIDHNIKFYNKETDYNIYILDCNNNSVYLDGYIESPILWNCDEPYLYRFVVETNSEILSFDLGIRKVEVTNSVIYINDKRIFLKGINRHDFSINHGRAVSRSEMEWDIKFIKEHNFNAVRTSHYPNDSYFYELCNKYGIFVINEVNLETHGTWQHPNGVMCDENTLPNDNIDYRDAVLDRARNLLSRDYNHPCVISWSLGNESFGGKTLFEMSEYFRKNDTSRFVHYEGISWDRRYNDTSDVESRMYPPFNEIVEYLENDGKKPYILCEYSHAMGNSNGNIHKYFELSKKYKSFQGAFIWEMFEHSLLKDGKSEYGGAFDDRPTDYNFVIDGIVSGERKITDKSEYIKYIQQPIEFKYDGKTLIIYNKYDFKDIKDYKLVIKEFSHIIYNGKINIKNNESISIDVMSSSINIEVIDMFSSFGNGINVVARKSFNFKNDFHKIIKNEASKIHVINSNINIGIRGKNFHHMFHKQNSTFSSINFNGKEFLYKQGESIKPNFWRVPTNNDIGASKQYELAKWKELSYNTKLEFLELIDDDNKVTIKTKLSGVDIFIDYIIDDCGSINLQMYSGDISMYPDLFCFGIRLPFAKEFNYFKYIGNGPEESYIDRNKNMLFDEYQLNVEDQYRYLVPQEYGNRTMVYFVELAGNNNHKIQFYSDKPFEFSYKSETDQSLEAMTHFGYSKTNVNELKIHARMTGVAGDDSWGAWAWDEYIVKSNEKNMLSFTITGI